MKTDQSGKKKKKRERIDKEKVFRYRCLCRWSKDDEYGFIPNANCAAHGKSVILMLRRSVNAI